GITGVSPVPSGEPLKFALEQNYPNPFNPSTEIAFTIPKASQVELNVYNVLGQQVATLVNGPMAAGSHAVTFNAANLASGVYFYRLQAGSLATTQKMLLMK
ncbi:MAG TPA: T9SS type A sorting domain-containing protein, partial [Bacteroidota bacterium]|nr:T9SS type A sorting domain-containing protein [Bacteroidota bacterium]